MKWLAATLVAVVCLVGILAYFKGVFLARPSESRASAAPGRIRGSDYAPVHGLGSLAPTWS
jgi:hypothetical protein